MEIHFNPSALAVIKRSLIIALICLPCLVFAQASQEDYGIYSQYLKVARQQKGEKIYFVVNETTAYSQKHFLPDIDQVVTDLRGYLTGNKNSAAYLTLRFRDFTKTLVTDTSWVSLLDAVNQKMKQDFKIENNFASDLQTTVVDKSIYNKFFKHVKTYRQIDRNWVRFHKQYPMPSELIEFSAIARDSKHAVFYFSTRCGDLCGEGDLVFFYKENNEWKYLWRSALWYN